MKAAGRNLLLALAMSGMSLAFQNCQGTGQNLPSASEMVENSTLAGGTGSGGGGSGQWLCKAEGSSVGQDANGNTDYSNIDPISITSIDYGQDATGLKALDACSGIMSIQTSLGTQSQYQPCQVTECHPIL